MEYKGIKGQMKSLAIAVVGLLAASADAHTRVWSVYVNGVDQGTGVGVRDPIPEGPPPYGYSNWPFKDVLSPDMKCHVLGDQQDCNTINVLPGDVVTFDWHHDNRTTADDIIATSHLGPCLIYISPDPPTDNSWVKLWHQGQYGNNQWCTTNNLIDAKGKLNVAIPNDLAPGNYLLRPELIALHEGDTMWSQNTLRGAQLYFECVQIHVGGDGTVELPEGVSFPGAYAFEDPGIHYNPYVTSPTYYLPGPTVWSGAAASPPAPTFGPIVGASVGPASWNTWVNGYTYTQTLTVSQSGTTTSFLYTPSWSTTYNTPTCGGSGTTTTTTTTARVTTTTSSTPSATTTTTTSRTTTTTTRTTVTVIDTMLQPHYAQCGGIQWSNSMCFALQMRIFQP
ncbi:hypothetical protein FRC04_000556 [Tulasnella sp. 424]|nr:hypothetical protein FRC04_000556 [Tulasnella sp. 424]